MFNNVISLLLGLKDLRDNSKNNVLVMVAVGYLDLIWEMKWWFFIVFLNNFSNVLGLHLFKFARGLL